MNSKASIQSYGRFKSLPWFEKTSQSLVFVGGAGGIGSHLTFYLARAGANVIVLDMDTVEDHNLGGQLYGKASIGKKKIVAISEVVDLLCGENNVTGIDEQIIEEEGGQWRDMISRCDAVCVGFDNLKAREIVYKEWKANGKKDSIFLDGRLSAESFQVYTLIKEAKEEEFIAYEETYFPESERVELPCTMKATTHWGGGIAWWMTTVISNHFNNITDGTMPRCVGNADVAGQLLLFEQPILKPKSHAVTKGETA